MQFIELTGISNKITINLAFVARLEAFGGGGTKISFAVPSGKDDNSMKFVQVQETYDQVQALMVKFGMPIRTA